MSQSDIPNNAGLLPGTTKSLNQSSMPLVIMMDLHTPICGMHELLCVHNIIFCVNGCFSFCLTSFIFDIFSKTEQ